MTATTRPKPPAPETYSSELKQVRHLTKVMRTAEQKIVSTGKERRTLLRRLRDRNVPFRILAEAAGLTEQAIYKDLRWGKSDD